MGKPKVVLADEVLDLECIRGFQGFPWWLIPGILRIGPLPLAQDSRFVLQIASVPDCLDHIQLIVDLGQQQITLVFDGAISFGCLILQ